MRIASTNETNMLVASGYVLNGGQTQQSSITAKFFERINRLEIISMRRSIVQSISMSMIYILIVQSLADLKLFKIDFN